MSGMDLFYFRLFAAFSFAFGACVASFLNVCIWRIPRGESVAHPPSHCPKCGAAIRWWQNVPILSWLALRGKCAKCREPISPRYAVVELLGGLLFLAVYLQWAQPAMLKEAPALGMCALWEFASVPAMWLAAAWLMLMAFIDLEHSAFPSVLLYCGAGAGPLLALAAPELQGEATRLGALKWSAIGAGAGFASLWLVRHFGTKIVRKAKGDATIEALGDGDPYFLAAVGGAFGPSAVLFTVLVSSFTGAAAGVAMMARGRAKFGECAALPYGPFLALGAVAWMTWGPRLLEWYLGLGAALAGRG